MVKAFSPQEVANKHVESIPDCIIEAVNDLLIKKYNPTYGTATIKQNEVIAAVEHIYTRHTIFDNNWLDFENLYRAQGWEVTYDKPGYCESYEAYWEFKRKK